MRFERDVCTDLEAALQREWLETNGLGGFASSTIAGLNTRRYHALLTAATRPPVGRLCLLAKVEETFACGDERYELSANQYPGAVHPQGFRYLKEFRLDPFPIFVYEAGGAQIIKSVFMIAGENSTVVQYELRDESGQGGGCRLQVRPLIACRDYHATAHENGQIRADYESEANLLCLTPYADMPALYLAHDAEAVTPEGHWYRNFEYREERERGLDFSEDLFQPLALHFDLRPGRRVSVIASTEPRDVWRAEDYREGEIVRRQQVAARRPLPDASPEDGELLGRLTLAADQFIVARGAGKSVIAGYHWFSDWGRDTMIALPGLMYVTDATVARSILLEFARHASRGMLPNRFPDAGEEPEYNTVDATLWFFEAVRALAARSGDYDFVHENLYTTLVEMVDWHVRGTRYDIKVDVDGLLAGGVEGAQLTWMDAKVGDYVVTPRRGKPVEIQALWYNALRTMADFARRFGDEGRASQYAEMATRARQSFNEQFWYEEGGYLYDVIDGGFYDRSLRPNQILAVSLPHTMLAPERARVVVETVERQLLTPYGLRSLARNEAPYRPIYLGDSYQRDTAYHQGTVWAWMMGPFITAYVKVNGRDEASQRAARRLLAGFGEHLWEAGLGQVSEIFDADPPHTPRGCIAQAWSVAELLRAACEDVFAVNQDRAFGHHSAHDLENKLPAGNNLSFFGMNLLKD